MTMTMMIDHETMWAVCLAQHDERLRNAAKEAQAAQLPRERSQLRSHLSRWLHGVATRLDPSPIPTADVLRPDMLVSR